MKEKQSVKLTQYVIIQHWMWEGSVTLGMLTFPYMIESSHWANYNGLFNLHVPPLALKARHLSGSEFCWYIHVHVYLGVPK